MLDWLGSQPGQTWQERWTVSGAEDASPWYQLPDRWLAGAGLTRAGSRPGYGLGAGLLLLVCGDVIRPGLPWLLASSGLQSMAAAMGRARDPDAFARLRRLCQTEQASPVTRDLSLRRIAVIMAAKGGLAADITAGDCVELCRLADDIGGSRSRGMYFYQLLRSTGVFPAGAPATSRMFITQGQLSPAQMLSRYAIACCPVHDLIADYLREQQLTVDHATLRSMAHVLGKLFWRDLERHHPGIGSLRLAPEVAAGWKQRILVKTSRSVTAAGDIIETAAPRTPRPAPCSPSARSTSTSPSGPPTIRHGGRRGPRPARSATARSPTPKSSHTARRGWTSGPVSACPPCPCSLRPSARNGQPRRPGSLPRPPSARRALHRRRADAAPLSDVRHRQARESGLTNSAPVNAAT